eukprot:TRINITY_DN2211_c0_g1_i3.p2 TRINITY_DN2211_c0_g1~~TRINITY_DN2211_c0_g1_i3.p2  ORF type:complete len:264 (+),score=52.02 TRINITY_DN2211_c0_g1_i3:1654-2445(+)
MIENLTDPAHLPFTHAGTIGRGMAKQPMTMKVLCDTLGGRSDEGQERPEFLPPGIPAVCVRVDGLESSYLEMSFVAPNITRFESIATVKGRNKMNQLHLLVPITKTKMRAFLYISWENFPRLPRLLPGALFDWANNRVVDEDVELLDGQQERLWGGAKPWASVVSADTLGHRYRKWREKEEKRGGVWFQGFDKIGDIEDLLSERKKIDTPVNFYDPISLVLYDKPGKDFCSRQPSYFSRISRNHLKFVFVIFLSVVFYFLFLK